MLDDISLDAFGGVVRTVPVLGELDENESIFLLRIRFSLCLIRVLNLEEAERVLDRVDLAFDERRLSRVELSLCFRRFDLDDLLVVICSIRSADDQRRQDNTTDPQSLGIASRTRAHTP